VFFPAFSNIGNDKDRVKRIYLRAAGIVALLGFPLMIGPLVVAQPFILTIYGNKSSVVIVRWKFILLAISFRRGGFLIRKGNSLFGSCRIVILAGT
jgi:O-antigen/teichoic acid export membrane protein